MSKTKTILNVRYNTDPQQMKKLLNDLNRFEEKDIQRALRNAANRTLTRTKKLVNKQILKKYTYQEDPRDRMIDVRAGRGEIMAKLFVKEDWKHQPGAEKFRTIDTAKGVMVQILKGGSPKLLELSNGDKAPARAFRIRYKSKHEGVAQRVPGKTYSKKHIKERRKKHLDVTKVKGIYAPRVTSMAKIVYDKNGLQEELGKFYQETVYKLLDKYINEKK